MKMIEIIQIKETERLLIPNNTEVIIGPKGEIIFLKDYQRAGRKIDKVFFQVDGSVLLCYLGEKMRKNANKEVLHR